jgi:7,8-dihydropterin-6-yl-methyl-4-(beta-D-ribofuranosyl)aminobenzene 5'-phosphate synthase
LGFTWNLATPVAAVSTGVEKADPEYIVPCHCTGWKATNKIIDLMPEKFIQSSVGTIFTF